MSFFPVRGKMKEYFLVATTLRHKGASGFSVLEKLLHGTLKIQRHRVLWFIEKSKAGFAWDLQILHRFPTWEMVRELGAVPCKRGKQ